MGHSEENNIHKPKKKTKPEGLIWLGVWLGLVCGFVILEIADVFDLLRQVFLIPVLAFLRLGPYFRESGIVDMLDVDYKRGNFGIPVRVVVFAVEMLLIMLPVYRYRKTKNRAYLYWLSGIAALVIAALCWFFFIFLSMIGMMD